MKKVYVGMSGGIDSSTASYILKKEGFDVTGVTFIGPTEDGYKKCCSIDDVNSARNICHYLGIRHKTIDVRDIFRAKIIPYFIESYSSGLTPNPCVICNRLVKFGAMMEQCLSEGADYFATGHYARITARGGNFYLQKGLDEKKDQSYFLSYMDKEKLPYIKLPLGHLQKNETRKIAFEAGLPMKEGKPESQDICFIKNDYREFLKSCGVSETPGDFILKGIPAGKHSGIAFYCLGQRKGLNRSFGERVFIRNFDVEKNHVILGKKPLSLEFTVKDINIMNSDFKDGEYQIQTRYRGSTGTGKAEVSCSSAYVKLIEPREIVSPGQFAVFYRDISVYASGKIDKTKLLE